MTAAQTPATFGAWVRTRRRQLDLTQAELGKRAGCSEAAIRKIEADERKPSRQLANLLAQALEIPPSEHGSFLHFSRGVPIEQIHIEAKSHPHYLPTLLTSTVDRRRELSNITALLKDPGVHLVTLIGTPGIGKTRLSILCGNELLDDFPNGVWFVDLADVSRADFFIPALARSLPGLDLPASPRLDQLLSHLKDQRLLLILDNVEQIAEGAALDAAQILKTCPHVKIMATSRTPLHIYGENEYPLPPLSIPPRDARPTEDSLTQFESVQLFLARVRQHQPKFHISPENAASVIEICTMLDGIPLALELAATTLRHMTLSEMVSVLQGQGWVKQLATPARDLPRRQRTLENVIDWSYSLLDDQQKMVFCRLGIFSGWFDAEASTTICETGAQPYLNALTDRSLLVRETIHDQPHWRMLELIHEYAILKLPAEMRSRVESLRTKYLLQRLLELNQNATAAQRSEFYQLHARNIYAAFRWIIGTKQTELGLQLAGFLEDTWSGHGEYKEGLALMRELFALPYTGDPALRADRLQLASDLAWQQHDFDTALAYSKKAVELGRKHGLKGKYAAFINRLGRIYIEQGRYEEAKQALQEGLELAHREPGNMPPGVPMTQLGEIALFEGRLEEARSLLERVLAEQTDAEFIFRAMAKTDLAEIALAQGNLDTAKHWLMEAYVPASQHARRFIIFLCALAGYLVLSSKDGADLHTVAQFYGAIEKLSLQSGLEFNAFYQDLNQRRMQLAQKKLSAQEWRAGYGSGSAWERGEAVQHAGKILWRKRR